VQAELLHDAALGHAQATNCGDCAKDRLAPQSWAVVDRSGHVDMLISISISIRCLTLVQSTGRTVPAPMSQRNPLHPWSIGHQLGRGAWGANREEVGRLTYWQAGRHTGRQTNIHTYRLTYMHACPVMGPCGPGWGHVHIADQQV